MKKIIGLTLACLLTASTFTACMSDNKTDSIVSPTPSAITNPTPTPSMDPIIPSPSTSPDSSSSSVSDIDSESMGMTGKIESYGMAVKDAFSNDYIPDRVLTETEIQEKIGLMPEMYDEVFCEASTLDENPDIFVAVKAKTDKKEAVEKLLTDYKDKLANDTAYTANIEKIKAAQVHTEGDHVFLFILGANEFKGAGEDLASNFAMETKKGIDAIKNMFR